VSAKNIVNPDHYKLAGRDRPNEVILPGLEKRKMAAESRRWERKTRQPWAAMAERPARAGKPRTREQGETEEPAVAAKRSTRKTAARRRTRKPATAKARRGGAASRRRPVAGAKARRTPPAAAR
jgi:hypothetical protein